MTEQVYIDSINIGERHRTELGDVASLAKSIREVGLLHPIVITPDNRLIAGERRIAAFKELGRERIPVTIIDLDDVLSGEWAENEERKPFIVTERIAISEALRERVAAINAERQREHGNTAPGKSKNTFVNVTKVFKGDTRLTVAKAIGMSGPTYDRARAVTTAAAADPETFATIAAEMDTTGNVQGAYKKLNAIRQATSGPQFKSREGVRLRRDKIIELAEERWHVDAIAAQVGVGKEHVRLVLRRAGVETVGQRIGALHRPKATRSMEGIIEQAMPAENAVALVLADWDALDRERFTAWADDLHTAITTLRAIERRLRKELS